MTVGRALDNVLLLGGGSLLLAYLETQGADGPRTVVLSSPRHLAEAIPGRGTFRKAVEATGTRVEELAKLDADTLRALDVDLSRSVALSFGAAWIIKQEVIDLLDGRVYNLHGARLPQDRGGASTSWQIMRGNRYGFALMHRVDVGVDTGDILAFHEFLYDDCATPLDFQRRYERETLSLLERVMPRLLGGSEPGAMAQPPYLASYWPRLNTEMHGWIDWAWSGQDIVRFIAAFDEPYAGAHTELNGRTVYFKRCSLDTSDGPFHPFQAGLIYRVSDTYAAVCSMTGTVVVRSVSDAEGREIPPSALAVGDRFFTPLARLETARRTRVQYTPSGLRAPRE